MQKEFIAILKLTSDLQEKVAGMEGSQEMREQLNIVRRLTKGLMEVHIAANCDLFSAKTDVYGQLDYLKNMIILNDGMVNDTALLNIAAAADTLAEKTALYITERNRLSKRACVVEVSAGRETIDPIITAESKGFVLPIFPFVTGGYDLEGTRG